MRPNLLPSVSLLFALVLAGCHPAEEPAPHATPTAAVTAPQAPPPAVHKTLDPSYIAADFPAALVVHPARIARLPLADGLLKEAAVAAKLQETGIEPAGIDEIVVLMPAPGRGPDPKNDLPAIIVRFNRPVAVKEMAQKFFKAVMPQFVELQEAKFVGHPCYRLAAAPFVLLYAPSDRVILLAAEPRLRAMLAAEKGDGPLARRLAAADAGHDALVAVVPQPVEQMVTEGVADAKRHAPPPIKAVAEGIEVLQGGTLALDLEGDTLLAVEFTGADAAAGGKIVKAIRQGLDFGRHEWPRIRTGLPKPFLEQYGPTLALVVQALGEAKAESHGATVTATANRPADFDTTLRALVLGLF